MTQPIDWNAGKPGGLDTSMSLASGEETVPRQLCGSMSAVSNGVIRMGIMRAKRTERITQLRMISGTTAAVAATDAWLGVYEIVQQPNGTWVANLVGITADDATIFSVASTRYARALVAPFTKQAGHYYSVTALILGATTSPTALSSVLNPAIGADVNESAASPPISIQQSALAALPQQQPVPGNLSTSTILFYGVMVP